MKRSGLEKAFTRLIKARKELEACERTIYAWDFEEEWSNFLLAYHSIFSSLEQAVKGCSKSEPWFGRVKHQRRKDPLLAYLHQARNSDEHGIDKVLHLKKETKFRSPSGDPVMVDISGGKVARVWSPTGALIVATEGAPSVALSTVTDSKHGDIFTAPREHLGRPLTDASPLYVAKLALDYAEKILIEASELPLR